MITGATHTCLHVKNSYSAKGLLAEICPAAIMVLMPVNQVDTAFEYAVIFVCWKFFRVSQHHRERNCYMIMLLYIVIDHLHHILTYTYFI